MNEKPIPPTPWQLIEEYPAGHFIADANGVGISSQMDRNIKEHVIKCVNSHESNLKAMNDAYDAAREGQATLAASILGRALGYES